MTASTPQALTLGNLPQVILSRIINHLPQSSKINLAYTNYDFYSLTMPLIYKKICLRKTPVLDSHGRGFQEALFTSVYGTTNILASNKSQERLFKLRQEILLQSLTLNESLISYIEEIVIFDEESMNDSKTEDVFDLELIQMIKTRATNLKKYIVYSKRAELHLSSKDVSRLSNLKSVILPHINMLQYLPSSVDQLKIDFIDDYKHEGISNDFNLNRELCLERIYQLKELDLSGDEIMTVDFLKFFFDILKPSRRLLLNRVKFIVYHGFNDYNILCRKLVKEFLFNSCDLHNLRSLEVVCGCDEMACPCLGDFFKEFTDTLMNESTKIENIAFSQKTVHRDHNYTEKFDMSICDFLKNIPNVSKTLKYLSIRHMPPLDSNMGNGFDGNYLKRKELYAETLPTLQSLQVLIVPLFMQTIACYEQYTSDLLWNGCNCRYCDDYLSLFDEYIMKHYYFDESSGLEKDVISSVMFGAASDVMSRRIYSKGDLSHNASDLDILQYPASNSTWDFHGYFGLRHHSDYNCEFNQSVFPSLVKVTSHFLEEYVTFLSGKLPKLGLFCLNGVYFTIDQDHDNGFKSLISCVYDPTD